MSLPTGPTTTLNAIPAYLYTEYNDDQYVQALVDAYNAYAQGYLNYLNNLNLPIYPNGNINGSLLDWVGTGIYGYPRPGSIPQTGTPAVGPFNTFLTNGLVFNGYAPATGGGTFQTTDDIYKRILTWHFYKGDGKQISVPWLRRRIFRFLYGHNGGAPPAYPLTAISAISNFFLPNSVQTTIPHGFHPGNLVYISGVNGIPAINGGPFTVFSTPSTTLFTINHSFPGGYVSGGVVTPNADTRSQNIGIVFTSKTSATITLNQTVMNTLADALSPPNICSIFQAAVGAGILELPFAISWTVNII